MRRLLLALLALLACADVARADPDALWNIVSQKCDPNWREYGDPKPCAEVDSGVNSQGGYAILKDRVGDTQYLLIPTAKVTGIEDPAVIAPNAPNYFADAWRERHFTTEAAKRDLPRGALSLAVNSAQGRSQNQLHIHIDCVAPTVRDAILRRITVLGNAWAPFPEPLAGHPYRALLVSGDELTIDPFRRLADSLTAPNGPMGNQTLVVVGADLPGGAPGFVVLADQVNVATGDHASGEELQDHSCALARQ